MKKSFRRFCGIAAILLAAALCLGGCGRRGAAENTPVCRVVTGISVTYENGPMTARRNYTASDKMREVLNYLRWVDPYGAPDEDPETADGSSFLIVLTYSDGCEKRYLQKADRFLLEEGRGWRKIDPTRAMTLGQILGQMKSDPEE